MINFVFRCLVVFLLRLRYRIRLRGMDDVLKRGRNGILFLPNHPALIEPIIVATYLNRCLPTGVIADETQMERPVIGWAARRIGVRTIPDTVKTGSAGRGRIQTALDECAGGLKNGENWLMYPAGRVYRQYLEDLRGNSAIETILREYPDVRIVLVRSRGLWGSGFSWASGRAPSVAEVLKKGAKALLLNGIFFSPRREVSIDLCEPHDLPRDASRETLNSFVQGFFNEDAPHNTYVPFTIWEKGGTVEMPEPDWGRSERDAGSVPKATREIVIEYLRELTGKASIGDDDKLSHDLGLDSLARADLLVWLESEFGCAEGNANSLETVADVLMAACGESFSAGPVKLEPVPPAWFNETPDNRPLTVPAAETITEAFLAQAGLAPDRVIIADQTSGAKTYRDLVTAIMVLKPEIERLSGDCIGIMMPASVAADILYLSVLFAGKTPVMVNWTAGPRNVEHSLGLIGVRHILTAKALVDRLETMGANLGALNDRFVFLEEIAAGIGRVRKLSAWARSRLSWASLDGAEVTAPATAGRPAVILFTSGSEAAPKAVPLTHANILSNVRDIWKCATSFENDRLIGFLPPFHSFGLTCTVILPLVSSLPTVYHSNPMDAGTLAHLIKAYRVTFLMGTPTFLGGIVRAARGGQLSTLRIGVTGAEKCPERVYDALAESCPRMTILEGYGITECSPVVAANRESAPRRFTIGKVLPSVEYAVVDVDSRASAGSGRRARQGGPGVLLVRGESIFGGYINYEGDSPFVEFEGKTWYRTGDIVCEDGDGVLTFSGRLKRFIKLGGEMISLPAIEAVLEQVYSWESDEGPVIAVEATSNEESSPEIVLITTKDLDRAMVNGRLREAGLSPLHNIRRLLRVDAIPVLGTGKTDYRALKRMLGD